MKEERHLVEHITKTIRHAHENSIPLPDGDLVRKDERGVFIAVKAIRKMMGII